jgi:3-methyladenine DNA glycosylase AlkD
VSLADAVRAALIAAAQPAKAGAMQAYMKSAMPFLGVGAPARRSLVRQLANGRECGDVQALRDTMLALWRAATHREERYAALDLLHVPRHARLIALPLLPALQEMMLSGAWWDFNDEISGRALPRLLERHPLPMKATLRAWATGDELWQRRAAMLAQRGVAETAFDAVLLYDCILPSLLGPGEHATARDFFIRKGIGWALRERSYAAPAEVQAFCAHYAKRLSPLSQRGALKVITKRAAAR